MRELGVEVRHPDLASLHGRRQYGSDSTIVVVTKREVRKGPGHRRQRQPAWCHAVLRREAGPPYDDEVAAAPLVVPGHQRSDDAVLWQVAGAVEPQSRDVIQATAL